VKKKVIKLADIIQKNPRCVSILLRHRFAVLCRHRPSGRV